MGHLDELRNIAGKRVKEYDLRGKCLMPAFIDAHSHITMAGQVSVLADLTECMNYNDIVQKLKSYIKDHHVTAKQAVLGFGYDHNTLCEEKHPTRQILDMVSQDIPIMILHISGHMACVNSKVLQMCGITWDMDDPEGGVIGREDGGRACEDKYPKNDSWNAGSIYSKWNYHDTGWSVYIAEYSTFKEHGSDAFVKNGCGSVPINDGKRL